MTLLLVDFSQICYSAYYGTGDIGLKIIQSMEIINKKFKPSRTVLLNDLTKSRYRESLTLAMGEKDYKGNREEARKKMTEKEIVRKKEMNRWRGLFPEIVKNIYVDGSIESLEADDVISLLANDDEIKKMYNKIQIISNDKDLLQIPAEQYAPYKLERIFVDKKLRIERELVPLFLALQGDTADNIQGIKGCGEDTARYLVTKYKTPEALYNASIEDETNKRAKVSLVLIQADTALLEHFLKMTTTFTDFSNMNEDEVQRYQEIKEEILWKNSPRELCLENVPKKYHPVFQKLI